MTGLRKYGTSFLLVFQDQMQYRMNLFITWLLSLYTLIVPFALWSAIFKNGTEISGYDFKAMITYTIVNMILSKLILANGMENTIAESIRSGKLSSILNKPIDYKLYLFMTTYGKKVFDFMLLLLPYAALMFVFFLKDWFNWITGANLLLFFMSIVLGMLLSFLIYFMLGLVAFWMVECSALYITLGTIFYFLAGGLFPLDLFTGLKQWFALFPFQYQLFFPIKVFLGTLNMKEIWSSLGMQALWIFILFGITAAVWRAGLRKYTSVGG